MMSAYIGPACWTALKPVVIGIAAALVGLCCFAAPAGSMTIDHRHTRLAAVPLKWIEAAKRDLHIAYGHTSHGSQITTGMTGLTTFAHAPYDGSTYTWNGGGAGGALDLADTPFSGAHDLGNPDFTAWAAATRRYLDDPVNAHVNVVIWSWCGQVSGATKADITTYLTLMSGLERDYPAVRFVYMTGHTDGSGLAGTLHVRNQQIRDYCAAHDKILYDFEDIESYDPDGKYFGDKHVSDSCAYDGGNWAIEWQKAHRKDIDWYECESAHSQPLNANLKAYAAWWLWARLAGWEPSQAPSIDSFTPTSARTGTRVTLTGSHFTGATAVSFGGIVSTEFVTHSDTRMTVRVPSGAVSGRIRVIAPSGTAVSVGVFAVKARIVRINPVVGKRRARVVIKGSGFGAKRGGSIIRFGTVKCGGYISWSRTQIVCRVPAKVPIGQLLVRMSTSSGRSNTVAFTVKR